MNRFRYLTIAVGLAIALAAGPAFAGKNNADKHDPVAKEASHLQKGIDKANAGIEKDQAKLAKLALQDQTKQKVIDKTATVNADIGLLGSIAAAFQVALDALVP